MSLSLFLLRRIAVSGFLALVAALLWQILSLHLAITEEHERAAATMQRLLQMQFVGFSQSAGLEPKFPDWDPIRQIERPIGSCVRLETPSGAVLRSACTGYLPPPRPAPAWFASLYERVLGPASPLEKSIEGPSGERALLVLVPEARAESDAVWRAAAHLAVPAALIIGLLCVVSWWSVARALRPVGIVMRGLGELECGDVGVQLGPFPSREFNNIAHACNRLASRLTQDRAAREELSRKLISVQEEERQSLARDLHDEFGQHLAAISASAAAVRIGLADGRAHDDVERIDNSVTQMHRHLRAVLQKLKPWNNADMTLDSSLRELALAGRASVDGGRTGAQVRLDTIGAFNDLDRHFCGAVYRIVQETVTNAHRHAGASLVTICLRREGGMLQVSVTDDGVGCSEAQLNSGYGIPGIRERCMAYGAEPVFESPSTGGFHFRVTFALGTPGGAQ